LSRESIDRFATAVILNREQAELLEIEAAGIGRGRLLAAARPGQEQQHRKESQGGKVAHLAAI
jgi:hypothetical protein